ncbi:hypothetical protein I6M58_11105 [Shewanella algae]|nr:hypothetical protein [Shewanella algae]MBO2700791.1 hypothetical protein [Shewanella algae]
MLIVVSLVFALSMANASLDTAKANLESSELQKSQLQLDADLLTKQLLKAEKDKADLRLNADRLERILGDRERDRLAASDNAEAVEQATRELLEDPEDEDAQAWAVAAVPDELNRLLWHNSYCADSNRNGNSVCATARVADESMRNPGLSGQNQSRAL